MSPMSEEPLVRTNPRHNEDDIQLGIQMFKKACSDARQSRGANGNITWSGTTCEGGGWTLKHKLNEDAMTPRVVASECGIRSVTDPANAAYAAELRKQALKYITQGNTAPQNP